MSSKNNEITIRPSQYGALLNLHKAYNSYYDDAEKYSLAQLDFNLIIAVKEVLDAFQQELNLGA